MERRRWRDRLGVGVLILSGCASTCGTSTAPGTIGELGNGRFLYHCTGDSDPVCELANNEEFPDCIALGGVFDLEFMVLDTSIFDFGDISPVLYVESVNQDFFRGDDDYEALRTGEAAFLVREDNRVLDLLHLNIVRADGFEIIARDPATPSDSIQIELGDTQEFRVFPRSSSCQQLGGSVPIEAESSDIDVASTSDGEVLRIQAQALGTAVVRVRQSGHEQAIAVEVVEGVVPPATSTDSGSDSGSGTGDETATSRDSTTAGTGGSTSDTDGGSSSGGSSTGMATR
ncbi:MAG: hypothetical protein AAF799_23825 [Myxococcota bacterium]